MTISLANKYYLQAIDAYPFDLTEVLESLNYALSADPEHAGAHCLMGRLYSEQLKLFDKAEYHFEQALISDMNSVATFEHYSLLLIKLKEYSKAQRLLKHAYSIRGCNKSVLQHREALIFESQKKYSLAKKMMKTAYNVSYRENERNFLKNELERIKSKLNKRKKKKHVRSL